MAVGLPPQYPRGTDRSVCCQCQTFVACEGEFHHRHHYRLLIRQQMTQLIHLPLQDYTKHMYNRIIPITLFDHTSFTLRNQLSQIET